MPIDFPMPPATPSSEYDMTLTEARDVVRNMGLTAFSDPKTDQAIQSACNEALRLTHCNQTTTTFTLTSGTETYNASAIQAQLRTPRILDMRIGYDKLSLTSFADIAQRYQCGMRTGKPCKWAAETPTKVTLYPQPDAAYVLTVKYWSDLVPLVSGATILNIPREFLMPILIYGAAAVAASHDPDKRFQSYAWRDFLEKHIPSIKAACTPRAPFIKKPVD